MLMSVPGVWGTVTPPMFPCVCDGITFEREGTRIRRRRREEGPTWILAAFCRVFFVVFGPLRNGSLRRFSLGDTKHLTPIEATIVSLVDFHGCPILSPRICVSGENKRPQLHVERQCSLDICELFMAISSHDESRACYFSNSTRLRGINNRRKHRTNSRTTFSMSGFVGRTEIATVDIAYTSETASLLSVRVCENMGDTGISPPFGTRPVRNGCVFQVSCVGRRLGRAP